MKIRVKSITYAMRGQNVLSEYGIFSTVTKDIGKTKWGCLYSLSLDDRYASAAFRILRENGVPLHPLETTADEFKV